MSETNSTNRQAHTDVEVEVEAEVEADRGGGGDRGDGGGDHPGHDEPTPAQQRERPTAEAGTDAGRDSGSSPNGGGSRLDEGGSPAGRTVRLDRPDEIREAIEAAFDYRGDVTIETADDRTIEGYVFDRRWEDGEPGRWRLRLLPSDGGARVTVTSDAIRSITFSSKDPAAGKSWETWVKKYVRSKLEGRPASR